MKRRSFIQTSIAILGAAAAGSAEADETKPKTTELYELRVYSLETKKQAILDKYLSKAFLPATKRNMGSVPSGFSWRRPTRTP